MQMSTSTFICTVLEYFSFVQLNYCLNASQRYIFLFALLHFSFYYYFFLTFHLFKLLWRRDH